MSDSNLINDRQPELFDEACRLTGLAYLMQIMHGDTPSHQSLLHELRRLDWLILLDTGFPHPGLRMAIELLENTDYQQT
ncbi:hypothetical protein [Enterobacter huaxiensis]|uniref:hypothetical protein n=1 Tax=Enterobacter huaxiensis TaxID=2494702 RepID=UPI0021D8A3E9|nr:hypothetical protein [Enterobacter huaxiensis]